MNYRERFEREAALVADRNLQASDIVRLNIGGQERVSVARSTLTLYEDSMLGAMFSGRHKVRTMSGLCLSLAGPGLLNNAWSLCGCTFWIFV